MWELIGDNEMGGCRVVSDGGGYVGGMVDVVERFMDGACDGEVLRGAVVAVFCVDEKEEEECACEGGEKVGK